MSILSRLLSSGTVTPATLGSNGKVPISQLDIVAINAAIQGLTPGPNVPATPGESADKTTITAPGGAGIVNAAGETFNLVATSGQQITQQPSGGSATTDATTQNVVKLYYLAHKLYQQANNGGTITWWSKTRISDTWTQVSDPTVTVVSDPGAPVGGQLVTAKQAGLVMSGIGLNVHAAYEVKSAGSYVSSASTIAAVKYMGVFDHLRDYGLPDTGSVQVSYANFLHAVASATGTKWMVAIDESSQNYWQGFLDNQSYYLAQHPTEFLMFEGPNEEDSGADNGITNTSNAQAAAFMPTVVDTARNAGKQVMQMSFGSGFDQYAGGNAEAYQNLNSGKPVDYANAHLYPPGSPSYNPQTAVRNAALGVSPGKPEWDTEYGWRLDGGAYGCVSQAVQAVYYLGAIHDKAARGIVGRTFYALIDDGSAGFGLYNHTSSTSLTPRPAATALHNLQAILGETAADKLTHACGQLGFKLSGWPSTLGPSNDILVMQKSDGRMYLWLYNQQLRNNQSFNGADIALPAATVTLTLTSTFTTINRYDPVASASAVQTASAANALTWNATDHQIIELIK